MNELRNRALRAAQEHAEQRKREAAAEAARQQQYEADLVRAAEAMAEKEFGMQVKFTVRDHVVDHRDYENIYARRAVAEIEGVTVVVVAAHWPVAVAAIARPGEPRRSDPRTARTLLGRTRRNRSSEWRPRNPADVAGVARSPVVRRFHQREAVAHHKKWACTKVPWWKRRGQRAGLAQASCSASASLSGTMMPPP